MFGSGDKNIYSNISKSLETLLRNSPVFFTRFIATGILVEVRKRAPHIIGDVWGGVLGGTRPPWDWPPLKPPLASVGSRCLPPATPHCRHQCQHLQEVPSCRLPPPPHCWHLHWRLWVEVSAVGPRSPLTNNDTDAGVCGWSPLTAHQHWCRQAVPAHHSPP